MPKPINKKLQLRPINRLIGRPVDPYIFTYTWHCPNSPLTGIFKFFSIFCPCNCWWNQGLVSSSRNLRSREYRMNCSTVDIPFFSDAFSGERIWVILKVANLMRKVWWLWQEEKEKKKKKLIWRFAAGKLNLGLQRERLRRHVKIM